MSPEGKRVFSSTSRREFLKTSGTALAGTALLSAMIGRSYAGEDNTIKIALVGCGGRGTGAAANALSTQGPTKLWAMADVFDNRLQSSLRRSAKQFEKQVDVPPERQFVGMDGYKKAIDALGPGGVVLLATPPAFRPMHVEYAVAKGCTCSWRSRSPWMARAFAACSKRARRPRRRTSRSPAA